MSILHPDQAYSVVCMRAQKLASQWGDGDAMVTFWKLSLTDYYSTHLVRNSLYNHLIYYLLKYKYQICTLRYLMAAEGVFGQKIMYDARYNWGVNTKGYTIYLYSRSILVIGKPGHNVEGDVHLEHHQGRFKVLSLL